MLLPALVSLLHQPRPALSDGPSIRGDALVRCGYGCWH